MGLVNMCNNLHITTTSFTNESRILKETATLMQTEMVPHIYITALHEAGVSEYEKIDNVRTLWRVPLKTRKWPRSLIFQLIKYLEFCIKNIRYAKEKKINLVNIHHLSMLPIGVLLKYICGAKLVYDTHELETETYGLSGVRHFISKCVERIFIKYADLVIVVGDAINEWYRNKYRIDNIVTVLNCPQFKKPHRTKRLTQELGIPENKKILLYQGGLIKGRGIEQLLKVFAEYDDQRHVLVLMGYGELEPLIKEFSDVNDNIYFKEAVPPSVVLQYTASADLGISYIDNPSLNDYYCLPNKLFEYIMAGLPVIVNNVPEQRRVINEKQIGIVLDELTAHSLGQALDDLDDMDAEILSKNIKRTAELFSWENQEMVMITAYEQYVFRGV